MKMAAFVVKAGMTIVYLNFSYFRNGPDFLLLTQAFDLS